MAIFSPDPDLSSAHASELQILNSRQIQMIEEALRSVGEYGEVRLVVEKGRVRFVITQKSFDTLKWQPGNLDSRP